MKLGINVFLRQIFFNLLVVLGVLCLSSTRASAQFWKKNDTDTLRKNTVLALPVLFYLPETRLGYGAFGMVNFYMNKEDYKSPTSLVQFGIAHTQNKQLLFYAPYNLFWKEGLWRAKGEIGYHKYTYDFFGVGPQIDKNHEESYEVEYPQFRIHLNRQVTEHVFVGGQYWFENMHLNTASYEAGSLLASGEVSGWQGGVAAGAGLLLTYDSRDHVYTPQSGWYIKGTIHSNSKITLSEYNFDRYRLDIRKYTTFLKNQTLAAQVFMDHITGNPPFTQMAFFGGSTRARGYYLGRYRDKNMLLGQMEYRTPVYGRLGAVAFTNFGMVAPQLDKLALQEGNYSYGVGLRFMWDTEKRVNFRLDAAFGPGTSGYYFTFAEAF